VIPIFRSAVRDRGGLTIEYAWPDAVRDGVIQNQVIYIPDSADYAGGIDAVEDAAVELLQDVLEGYGSWTAPVRASVDDEDDDEGDSAGEMVAD
jgi:hypothetical protein